MTNEPVYMWRCPYCKQPYVGRKEAELHIKAKHGRQVDYDPKWNRSRDPDGSNSKKARPSGLFDDPGAE
jgi:hypothetical protein